MEGAIPDELTSLIQRGILDLSEKNFRGTIPKGFFSMLTSQTLNVAFNNLSGAIRNQGNGLTFVNVNFTGNPYLCVEGTYCGTNTSPVVNFGFKSEKQEAWPIVVGVFAGVALMLFVVFVLLCINPTSNTEKMLAILGEEKIWTLTSFREKVYHENEVTTLDEENVIGADSSGRVYKVILGDG